MASENTTYVIEDAITLDGLRTFLAEADQRFAGTSTATSSANGLMSAADKSALDSMALTEAQVDAAVAAAFA